MSTVTIKGKGKEYKPFVITTVPHHWINISRGMLTPVYNGYCYVDSVAFANYMSITRIAMYEYLLNHYSHTSE